MNRKRGKTNILLDIKYQSVQFERLIYQCFKEKYKNKIHLIEANELPFDMEASDGLDFFDDNKKLYIEIKYSNRLDSFSRFMERTNNYIKSRNSNFLIIGLWDEEQIRVCKLRYNYPSNIMVLGKNYVDGLVKNYRWLQWEFAGSTYNNPKIELSNDGKSFILTSISEELYSPDIHFNVNDLENINNRFESIFKEKIIKIKKNPALIVGNGSSIPFGADSWLQMSNNIYDYIYPYYIDSPEIVKRLIGGSNYSITSMAKMLLPPEMYYSAIYTCIYRKYNKSMHTPNTLVRSIVKAKNKHILMPIFTYNYDRFIEYDYEKKYNSRILKSVSSSRGFSSISEPRIVHIHGMIDYKTRKAKKIKRNIILTAEDYFNAYKGHQNWVPKRQIELLENNVCLFVGSSMSDIYQMSIIDKVKKEQSKNIEGWQCFALMCLKGATDKDIFSIVTYYLKKGVYVIFVREFNELPSKLDDLMRY